MFGENSETFDVIEESAPRAETRLVERHVNGEQSGRAIGVGSEPGEFERRVNQIDSIANRKCLQYIIPLDMVISSFK